MRTGGSPADWRIAPLAPEGVALYASPDPGRVTLSSPTVLALPGGRLIAAFGLEGPGVRSVTGPKGHQHHYNYWLQGKVFVSNDKGATWEFRADFPFAFPRLFRDGDAVYLVGHRGNLLIMRSADGGTTWGKPVELTPPDDQGGFFTQGPAACLAAGGWITLALMRTMSPDTRGWPGGVLAPVVLRAHQGSVLAHPKSWTFAKPCQPFGALFADWHADMAGMPLFAVRGAAQPPPPGSRWAYAAGWDDARLVRVEDPGHLWHDPSGKSLHLLARAGIHRSNTAVVMRLAEGADGALEFGFEKTPAGKPWAFIPVPGGNLPFDVVYDETSRLYWLASNRVVDSMTRPDRLPDPRRGLPDQERHGIALHASSNLVDWSFAGLVDDGPPGKRILHSPALAIRGPDLCIVCRAGDAACRHALESNLITAHVIPAFRELLPASPPRTPPTPEPQGAAPAKA